MHQVPEVQILPQNSQFLILSMWPASSSVDVPRKHVQTLGRMQGQVNILPKASREIFGASNVYLGADFH